MKNSLTNKQQLFGDEYLIDFNATKAYKRAGYSVKSDAAAAVEAHKLLRNPKIKDYISKKQETLANRLQITQEMVLEGYRKLAFYDARKFYDANGHLRNVTELDDETAFALAGFEVEEKSNERKGSKLVYTKKIKMSDRKGALDSLCKVLGFNAPDKLAQTNTAGEDVPVQALTDGQFDNLLKSLRERSKTG